MTDLCLDAGVCDVEADVILLVEAEVGVAHDVERVDDASGRLGREERQLQRVLTAHVPADTRRTAAVTAGATDGNSVTYTQ